ncbi:DNA polymerase IV [Marinilactibacillus piezotolerans]|uniref:DNA polymerase IV n=1 Tax=Marinilactibacillus piezotolerans TaxID=258723 RepID=UPI0009AFC59D|nr:DNA polymerase IV [Marinilactibacillus piezotolerans]
MKYGILTFDEPKRDISRKIIHIDMDAFYASVEVRENPSLKGKPVIIARHPKENGGRGVVATASYEARQYGVHSAMSAQKAYELCPDGIFVSGNFELYRSISREIRAIFSRYTDLIQPLSLDEAYLDITENKIQLNSATLIAQRIQREIYQELRLTCSAGVSYNKFLAKLASDFKKPSGITVIPPEDAHHFLVELPIEKYHGVGRKSVEKMHELGIFKGQDLYDKSEMELVSHFGKMGHSLYRKVRGIDDSRVEADRDRKSVGKERTFLEDLKSDEEVTQSLRQIAHSAFNALKKNQKHGKTVVLKIRYNDFSTLTRRKTFPNYIQDADELFVIALRIFEEEGSLAKGIRLLGITVTNLDSVLFENIPLPLWVKAKELEEEEAPDGN